MYRDTSGQEGEYGVTSQDVSWTLGQHQSTAQPHVPTFEQPHVPTFGQQGRWALPCQLWGQGCCFWLPPRDSKKHLAPKLSIKPTIN